MRIVSDGAAVPRDDRAWPSGALPVSVAGSLVAVATSAALVASADSLGLALELLLVFVAVAALATMAFVDAVRPWLRGEQVPSRTRLIQPALFLLVLAMFVGGPTLGGAGLCGYLTGLFLPNASAMRLARLNRGLGAGTRSGLAAARSEEPPEAAEPPVRQARGRSAPQVSPVLQEALDRDRDRRLAWAASTAIVTLLCAATGAAGTAVLGVFSVGTLTVAVVSYRYTALREALRDFLQAWSEPRAAYVVMIHDPRPGHRRPLLGTWSHEPVLAEGRLPRPDEVYRCDEHQDALLATRGPAVVHEAWLEADSRGRSRPRWVAADAGIALPHRQAMFDRWYFMSRIRNERPSRPRPLTILAPGPATEVDFAPRSGGRSASVTGARRILLPRLSALTLLALLLVSLT